MLDAALLADVLAGHDPGDPDSRVEAPSALLEQIPLLILFVVVVSMAAFDFWREIRRRSEHDRQEDG